VCPARLPVELLSDAPGDTNGQGQGLGGNWFVAEP